MKQLILASVLMTISSIGIAETAGEKGLRIAKEGKAFDQGFNSFTADMQMVLRTRNGTTSVRRIRSKTLEVRGDGDKSLSEFLEPADVKGTKMLTHSHGLRADDQWLFLPALRRSKRISSNSKSGPFMGSEFAFEDLGSQELEKYTYKYLRDEPCGNGMKCYVVERIPAYRYTGYSKMISWVDQQAYRLVKVDFYDRKRTLLKTLTASGYHQYGGKHWRASKLSMVNHQTRKSTDLVWSNYRFKVGLTARDFNKNALKR